MPAAVVGHAHAPVQQRTDEPQVLVRVAVAGDLAVVLDLGLVGERHPEHGTRRLHQQVGPGSFGRVLQTLGQLPALVIQIPVEGVAVGHDVLE